MANNTATEMYDEEFSTEDDAPLTQEDILMSEKDILAGLLELGNAKDEKSNYRKIQIKRNGVVKLEFHVRPITEDENQICLKRATKFAPTKPGKAKIATESDGALYRSYLIYTATVNEDRAKIWDNQQAQNALGILQGVDMIDRVLFVGEKNRVLDVIDEISGFADEEENAAETAGNS